MIRALSSCLVFVLGITAGARPAVRVDDEVAVRKTLEHYLAGHATGDGAHMQLAFHPDAMLFVAGTAASAKIVLDYPTGRFVDYMSLLTIDGEWRIVNKIFHRAS